MQPNHYPIKQQADQKTDCELSKGSGALYAWRSFGMRQEIMPMRTHVAPFATVDEQLSQKRKECEAAKNQRMGKIAIHQKVQARPKRQGDQKRMAHPARQSRRLWIESNARAAKGEWIRATNCHCDNQKDGKHPKQCHMLVPDQLIPQGHERRAASRPDEPRQRPQ